MACAAKGVFYRIARIRSTPNGMGKQRSGFFCLGLTDYLQPQDGNCHLNMRKFKPVKYLHVTPHEIKSLRQK
jgi:hypothetical protein